MFQAIIFWEIIQLYCVVDFIEYRNECGVVDASDDNLFALVEIMLPYLKLLHSELNDNTDIVLIIQISINGLNCNQELMMLMVDVCIGLEAMHSRVQSQII